MTTAVLVDADASVPDGLLPGRPLLPVPAEAPRLLERETIPRLVLDGGPLPLAPLEEAARAAAGTADLVYCTVDDGFGSPEAGLAAVQREAAARGRTFAHLAGGGPAAAAWRAILAAEAARRGASVADAAGAGAAAAVGCLTALEHPELVNVGSATSLGVPGRAIARWVGTEPEVVARPTTREILLAAFRDRVGQAIVSDAAPGALRIIVLHSAAGAAADAMSRWLTRLGPAEVWVDAVTRHATSRLGPGFVAVAWVRDAAFEG